MISDMGLAVNDSGPSGLRDDTVPEDGSAAVGGSDGFDVGVQVAGRFVVNGTLGRGSSGEVLAVQDLSLDREVAMKVLRGAGGPAIARFMREARITARLDHPSVPPVHTLDFLPDGGLIFTMRRLEGTTLGAVLRQTIAGQPPAVELNVNAVVSLGLRVSEALARAHHLGIIHRDVKPDNIMLGSHGEVALVDWGECRLLNETDSGPAGSTVGTPAYMSPEQARGEPADARSDVYALGATLYHVLTRKPPTWDDDPAQFWEKKRAGTIDPLPESAASRLPRPLLAILLRAMAAEASRRYASAAAMTADLERFQGGVAVAAYRETPLEAGWRWLRAHRRGVLSSIAVLAACLVTGGVLWRQHQLQLADWGAPILVEDFAGPTWQKRWTTEDASTWSIVDGRLTSQGHFASIIGLNQVLTGAVAIEYDGEILPGSQPCDVSVVWTEGPDIARERHAEGRYREYWIQAGASDNYFCAIYRRPDDVRLDERPYRLALGRRHHFRVELDGRRIGMWIDGEQVLSAEESLPIATGRLCLYAYYPGKAFDHVRVWQKKLPEVTSVLSIGEAFLRQGLPGLAATSFKEVADSHPGSPLGLEATYLQGLARRAVGGLAEAEHVWRMLPPGELADRVAGHRLDGIYDAGRIPEACSGLVKLYRSCPGVRSQLRGQWQAWAIRALDAGLAATDPASVAVLADTKIALFPEHGSSNLEGALLLNTIGRYGEVVRLYPDELVPCAVAYLRLGRAEDMLARFPDAPGLVRLAWLTLGQFDKLQAQTGIEAQDWLRSVALSTSGRSRQVTAVANEDDALCALWQGQPDLVLGSKASASMQAAALAASGRYDEMMAVAPCPEQDAVQAMLGRIDAHAAGDNPFAKHVGPRLVALTEAGDLALRNALAARVEALWPNWETWLEYIIALPVLRHDREQLRERLEIAWKEGRQAASQRPYHVAGYALGRLRAEDLQGAPCAGEAALWRAVGDALRAELAGEPDAIRSAWGAYLALPWHRRLHAGILPSTTLEALARKASAPASRPAGPPSTPTLQAP